MSKVIYSGQATLPLNIQHTPESDAPVILQFSGTVYSYHVPGPVGLKLLINGDPVMDTIHYANTYGAHGTTGITLQSVLLPVKYDKDALQPVTFTIDKMNTNTEFDSNDTVSLLLID